MGLRKKKTLLDQARNHASDAAQAARPHVELAMDRGREFVNDTALPAIADAREKAGPALAEARETAAVKAAPVIADVKKKAKPVIDDARSKAAPAIADAQKKAGPAIADAKARVASSAAEAKDKAAPSITKGAAKAALAAEGAKVAAEKAGKSEKNKGGKRKKFLVLAALAGAGVVVARKLQGDSTSDNWQSSYTPTPPPPAPPVAPMTPAGPGAGSTDAGGSAPDEAIADANASDLTATTPEAPAEVVDLDPEADIPTPGDTDKS